MATGLGEEAAQKLAELGVTVESLGGTTPEILEKTRNLADECIPPDRPEWARGLAEP
jgi:hypothetical protein